MNVAMNAATSLIRLRIAAHDAHYAGGLVDGAKLLQLFGDVATELLLSLIHISWATRCWSSAVPASRARCACTSRASASVPPGG